MTRAPRPGVPPLTAEARFSPPASWVLATIEVERPVAGFGKRAKGPPRHAWEWAGARA